MSGKSKGGAFERKIAKEIVKAFKPFGIKQQECWRSVGSGGHAMSAGDLQLSQRLAQLFPFCLEMKHRKKIRWFNFMLEKDNNEEKRWLIQAKRGADKVKGMTPVLVMRANNCPIFALVGERSEVHDDGPEVWVDGDMWKLLPWRKFLRLAVELAKDLDTPKYRL
jgi:hypothetical protein